LLILEKNLIIIRSLAQIIVTAMSENNKLDRFNPETLPSYFDKLSKEQQDLYLSKLANDNADLVNYARKKVADSKTAENDMYVDLNYLSRLETENKMINVKRTYETGSGKMDINIKGGDRKLIIPIVITIAIVVIVVFFIVFTK
jgi:hypothetical protein